MRVQCRRKESLRSLSHLLMSFLLYFAVLVEIAYSRPFLGGFGGIFPPNMVTHRSNPQKDHPWAETRRLRHKA